MLDPTSTPSTLGRGSPRARSTRSIGDHLGLDRSTRSKVDRGSLRAQFLLFLTYININIINSNNADDNNNGGIAAHCCGIFSCTNPLVWPVGGVLAAVTAFLVFIHHIIVFHGFSLFFDVF